MKRLITNPFLILVNTFLLLTINCIAREDQDTRYNRDSVIAAAREIMEMQTYCALVTIDSSGRPQVRTMNPYQAEEDMTVWMATNRQSRKVKEIKNNPNVCLYYADHKSPSGYVAINGKAVIIDDKEILVKKKRDYWEQMVPDWKNLLVLIKIIPEKIDVLNYKRGILNDTVTWRTPSIEF